jgi:hypothetical protein
MTARHDAMDRVLHLRQAIEVLIARFAWLIDHEDGRGVADLFTTQGSYALDGAELTLRGRGEIDEFYERRRANGPRTSRHLFSNLHLQNADEARAAGTCVLTLHAANGHPPHPPAPVVVADYADTYACDDDGVWRFDSRTVTPLFGTVPQFGSARS